MRSRRVVIAISAAAAIACSVLLAGPAHAASGAYLRLAHLSPDTPQVDVYVASVSRPGQQVVVPGVGYGAVSPYRPVEPGEYTISMRSAGADPNTPPVLSTTLSAKSGAAYTVAGVGMSAGISLKVLEDDLALPPPGQVRCRVIHAAASTQQLDVGFDGSAALATNVNFAQATGYRSAPAGKWTLLVSARGHPVMSLPVDVAANGVYSVLVVDRDGKLAAELLTDAKAGSSGSIPSGAMETGLGGLADHDSADDPASPAAAAAWLTLIAGISAAVLLGSRRFGSQRRRRANTRR